MPPRKKAAPKPRAKAPTHKLPDPLPAGEIMRDYCKKEWKLGKPIGAGGFGLIYLADVNGPGAVSENSQYVMKLEPHANGPLFCELHFYQRVAKADYIEEWTRSRKLKFLGVPQYIASGSHENKSTKYRFMVMERCGSDLQKLFESNGKRFQEKSVYLLGIKMLQALEYVHCKEYVHADIKASNLLTGHGKGKVDEVYLVDYGLAYRYTTDGRHKEYKEDPKRVHDGTIEFTSRDAHRGVVPSRRGDLEILGYCMLQWLCGALPWEDNLEDKDYVSTAKHKYMKNISSLMKKCLPSAKHDELARFLQYCADLEYDEAPDYNKCRTWFKQALTKLGGRESDKIILTTGSASTSKAKATPKKASPKKRKTTPVTTSVSDSESDFEPIPVKSRKVATPQPKKPARKPATPATPKSVNGARIAANGDIIPRPAVPPPGLINGGHKSPRTPANKKAVASKSATNHPKSAKRKVLTSESCTQTSPGLKGLNRSRAKKRKT